MGKIVIISQEQFAHLYRHLASEGINVKGMTIVHHMKDSTPCDTIDGCSSPSEYWRKTYNEPIVPKDCICTSCMKKVNSEDFVVGHIESIDGSRHWLYPVCDSCNKRYKGSKASMLFYADNIKMKPVEI